MEDISEIIGKRIKEIREQNGYSKSQLAKLSGIHAAWISRLECGKRDTGKVITPSILTLQKVATGLSISITDLLTQPASKKTPVLQDTAILSEIKSLLKKKNNSNTKKQLFLQMARSILK